MSHVLLATNTGCNCAEIVMTSDVTSQRRVDASITAGHRFYDSLMSGASPQSLEGSPEISFYPECYIFYTFATPSHRQRDSIVGSSHYH
jgi:hypothetical protein